LRGRFHNDNNYTVSLGFVGEDLKPRNLGGLSSLTSPVHHNANNRSRDLLEIDAENYKRDKKSGLNVTHFSPYITNSKTTRNVNKLGGRFQSVRRNTTI